MTTKDWYKITFQIESNLEDLIIWKFNELGISSYAFEYALNSENKKKALNILFCLNEIKKKCNKCIK